MNVSRLTDSELRIKLRRFGYHVGPITSTTRELLLKKLTSLLEEKRREDERKRAKLSGNNSINSSPDELMNEENPSFDYHKKAFNHSNTAQHFETNNLENSSYSPNSYYPLKSMENFLREPFYPKRESELASIDSDSCSDTELSGSTMIEKELNTTFTDHSSFPGTSPHSRTLLSEIDGYRSKFSKNIFYDGNFSTSKYANLIKDNSSKWKKKADPNDSDNDYINYSDDELNNDYTDSSQPKVESSANQKQSSYFSFILISLFILIISVILLFYDSSKLQAFL